MVDTSPEAGWVGTRTGKSEGDSCRQVEGIGELLHKKSSLRRPYIRNLVGCEQRIAALVGVSVDGGDLIVVAVARRPLVIEEARLGRCSDVTRFTRH
jgi:hypothetical protein